MRILQRNTKLIYYALPLKKVDAYDKYGNITGTRIEYSDPEPYRVSFGGVATGTHFGNSYSLAEYGVHEADLTALITHHMDCPMTVGTVIWMGKKPYDEEGNLTPYTHMISYEERSVNVVKLFVRTYTNET